MVHIAFESLRSIILKIIWLLTSSIIICQTILIAIWSCSISFSHKIRLSQIGCNFIYIKSHAYFLMSMDFIIINYIDQLVKSISFLCLAQLLDLFFLVIKLLVNGFCCIFWFGEILENKWPCGRNFLLFQLKFSGFLVKKLWNGINISAAARRCFSSILILLIGSHNLINYMIL